MIKHVVFHHYEKLRWYFIDTQNPEEGAHLFLSINPFDIKYLLNGIYLLIPPLNKNHIKGNWN